MIKMNKEDFMEEVKAELYGYEEIGEENAKIFLDYLEKYFADKKGNRNRISYKANSITIMMKDESEIFSMVDQYLAAVDKGEQKEYFTDWVL